MTLVQSKLDATFRFGTDLQPDLSSKSYDGVLHLFEHQYDKDTVFWYGVANINCTMEDVDKFMRAGSPLDFSIAVRLEDGRMGAARQLNARYEGVGDPTYTWISLFGFTTLSAQSH